VRDFWLERGLTWRGTH